MTEYRLHLLTSTIPNYIWLNSFQILFVNATKLVGWFDPSRSSHSTSFLHHSSRGYQKSTPTMGCILIIDSVKINTSLIPMREWFLLRFLCRNAWVLVYCITEKQIHTKSPVYGMSRLYLCLFAAWLDQWIAIFRTSIQQKQTAFIQSDWIL